VLILPDVTTLLFSQAYKTTADKCIFSQEKTDINTIDERIISNSGIENAYQCTLKQIITE